KQPGMCIPLNSIPEVNFSDAINCSPGLKTNSDARHRGALSGDTSTTDSSDLCELYFISRSAACLPKYCGRYCWAARLLEPLGCHFLCPDRSIWVSASQRSRFFSTISPAD